MIIYRVDSDDPQGVYYNGTEVFYHLYREALIEYDERKASGGHKLISIDKLVVSGFSTVDLLNRQNFVETRTIVKEYNGYKD